MGNPLQYPWKRLGGANIKSKRIISNKNVKRKNKTGIKSDILIMCFHCRELLGKNYSLTYYSEDGMKEIRYPSNVVRQFTISSLILLVFTSLYMCIWTDVIHLFCFL